MTKLVLIMPLISALVFTGCDKNKMDVKAVTLAQVTDRTFELSSAVQQDIDAIAKELIVKYQHITNIPTDKCDHNKTDAACFEVKLSFTSPSDINVNDWSIYFSQITPVQSYESDWATLTHLNGDLHQITLKENFTGFRAGETKSILFRADFWSLSETDALPNYIVAGGENEQLSAKVIASTKVVINPETGLEILPYVEPYFDEKTQFKRTANDKTQWLTAARLFERNVAVNQQKFDVSTSIVPTPKIVEHVSGGSLDISKGIAIDWRNVDISQADAAIQRLVKLGVAITPKGVPLTLKIVANDKEKIGSYQLIVDNKGIEIIGVDGNGVFNGLQSLASLKMLGSNELPLVNIIDEPHYTFRGLLVDVARNFRSKAFILKLLDQMAAYKLNKLHFHLGDDEGWRLEIPSLPELTKVSSKRCFDPSEQQCLMPQLGAGVDKNSKVNGYYSVTDYQEILREASKRYIQVIPSLDMPGHSRAAVKAMAARYQHYMALEQVEKAEEFLLHDLADKTVYSSVQYYNDNTINVCMESSYHFIETVMKEVKAIHAAVEHPLTRYHIGADETAGAWLESPTCKAFLAKHQDKIASPKALGAYFVERVANMLAGLDIETAAWIDGLEHTNPNNMPAIIQANAWHPLFWEGHKSAHQLANYNWQIVVSNPDVTYFDFPYEADPKEHGYYWASRQINTQKLFNFMPDNLPANAEWLLDREDNHYVADDTFNEKGNNREASAPLNKGVTFLGIQGQLWSENTRTDNTAEYKIFPRLLALAERAWHQPTWTVPYNYNGAKYSKNTDVMTAKQVRERDVAWSRFAHTLGKKELPKLALADVHFRLPTVGAKLEGQKLYANSAYPGLVIEYQEGDQPWQMYTLPVMVGSEVVKVRAANVNNDRKGRELKVNKQIIVN